MKLSRNDVLFLVALLACVLALLLVTGCSTQKHVQTKSVDSSVIKVYEDSVRMLRTENERLFSENMELQYLGISFDTVFMKGDTVRNVITIHDGNIEASGNIKSANFSKSVYSSLLLQKDKLIDSLRKVKDKVETKVVTEYKDRTVKKTFIPFWVWVVMIGLVVFNFRKQIKNLI